MKINKLFIAAAAVTMLFASCTKEETTTDNGTKAVTISLTSEAPISKAIGTPGTSQVATITDGDGIIFIVDASDNVKQVVAFANNFPTTSQVINRVAATDKVYVIANIGSANKTAWTGASKPATLTAIKALSMSIADATNGQVYTKATIANKSGAATGFTVDPGVTAVTLAIAVAPVYSRIELATITGSGNITSFTVAGVYVDDYYPSYTMGHSFTGILYQQLKSPTVFGQIAEMKNEGTWASVSKIAKPNATTDRWVYNVPAGNMPRLIIKLTNVVGTWTGGGTIPVGDTFFLTIKGYNSVASTTFAPGMIYTITGGITFTQDNLGTTPNAETVALTVSISHTPWAIGALTADLM